MPACAITSKSKCPVAAVMAICILFGSWIESAMAEQLQCNICWQADIVQDCHLNIETCRHQHVCFIEVSRIRLASTRGRTAKDVTMYKMGCEHYSMCKDRMSSGPGPYGYTKTTKFCCCSDRCDAADGIGSGKNGHCPMVWGNYTIPSHAPTLNARVMNLWGLNLRYPFVLGVCFLWIRAELFL